MRFYGLIAAVAIGCSGKEPPDEIEPPLEDPTTEETDDPPIDTAPDGAGIDARFFAITARFAYDSETNEHVQFAETGEGLSPIALVVTLMDSSVAYDQVITEANSCTVTIEVDQRLPSAPWVETLGAWTGFDLPPGSPVRDVCQFYGLPSEFEGDAGKHISKWRYGVGIAELDSVVAATLRNTLPASEWDALEPYAVGAILVSNLFDGTGTGDGFTNSGFGLGYAVDGNFEIVVDGVGNPDPIPKAEVDQEVGVARGYYEITVGPFEPGTGLTYDPL